MFHPLRIFIARLLLTDFRKHAQLAIPEIDHMAETYWNGPSSEELKRIVSRRRKDRLFAVCSSRTAYAYLWGHKDMLDWLRLYSQLTSTDLMMAYTVPVALADSIDASFRRLTWILRGHELAPLGDYVPPD